MNIGKIKEAGKLTAVVVGRLDTTTSPILEDFFDENLDGVEELVVDLAGLEYVSSAGLRVILRAQKRMSAQGKMKLVNVGETVMEVFEITGFADILDIE